MARGKAALILTAEEIKLFSEYLLERSSSQFGLQELKQQKRHAEQMLSISRPQWYQAYMIGKEGISDREAKKRARVELSTINKRRELAVEWLLKALGRFKE